VTQADDANVTTNSSRQAFNITWILCLVPVVVLAGMAWQHRWVGDDSFVNFRIVKQLEAGNGPVYNIGQRVEAGTSLLWVIVLFVADLLTPLRLEWISVLLGIALTVVGLVLAQRAAWLILQPEARRSVVVPFGALLLAALPPMWDYATSGLETGLCFAWLGGSFWGLARQYQRNAVAPGECTRPPVWLCVVIGLGPLVRPDFAIYSAAFMVAMFVIDPGRARDRARALVAVFAIPVASEIFRMAYYASLVPNTALTKESGRANWHQGWSYFGNYVGPYVLWLPFVVVAGVLILGAMQARAARDTSWLVLVGAPVAGALVHAAWVVRVGGDFMHARFLLPATFAVLLPVSVLPVRNWRWIPASAIVVWAVVCAFTFRVSFRAPFTIVDERRWWQVNTRVEHPIVSGDFRRTHGYANSARARAFLAEDDRVASVLFYPPVPLAPDVRAPLVIQVGTLGVAGYRTPTDVVVLDALGLADPLGSRLRVAKRGRPGHEKRLPGEWVLARYTRAEDPAVAAARRALDCGQLRELILATSGPLGISEVFRNIVQAPRLTTLRLSGNAATDRAQFCK
jgi:arabinofuranosyltransferase